MNLTEIKQRYLLSGWLLLIGGFLALILAITSLTSCETTIEKKKTEESYNGSLITEVIYDGCTYVKFDVGRAAWGAHKGNCSNPIHKQNKQ